MKNRVYLYLFMISLVFVLGCKKQTQNRILGKWERVMLNTDQSQNYGHRNLISERWDFRDFKYVYLIKTLSGQVGALPGTHLDSLPIIQEDRRQYEIIKKKKINIINEKSGEIWELRVDQLDNGILKMTHIENGIIGNTYDFYRSEEN